MKIALKNIQFSLTHEQKMVFTVKSGLSDTGISGNPGCQHNLLGPGRFPISSMHFTALYPTSPYPIIHHIRHVFWPLGKNSFIFPRHFAVMTIKTQTTFKNRNENNFNCARIGVARYPFVKSKQEWPWESLIWSLLRFLSWKVDENMSDIPDWFNEKCRISQTHSAFTDIHHIRHVFAGPLRCRINRILL